MFERSQRLFAQTALGFNAEPKAAHMSSLDYSSIKRRFSTWLMILALNLRLIVFENENTRCSKKEKNLFLRLRRDKHTKGWIILGVRGEFNACIYTEELCVRAAVGEVNRIKGEASLPKRNARVGLRFRRVYFNNMQFNLFIGSLLNFTQD